MSYQVNDRVEVRSKEEILATLDQNGRLDGLPFMPQMFAYCGKQFKIYKNAHKTCDTVSGKLEIRKIPDTVHLDIRCDGKAYGGCQASCLIFWKEAWLKKIGAPEEHTSHALDRGRTVSDVWNGVQTKLHGCGGTTRYTCQATQLLDFTAPLKWWDPRQFIEDYKSGNATIRDIINVCTFFVYRYGSFAKSERWGSTARWLYDTFQKFVGGSPYPKRKGNLPKGQTVPNCALDLQPGELVRVKPYSEILNTINSQNIHLGLWFDADMVPYCGKVYRVRARVQKFIDERTGVIKWLKTPAIILEGVICQSRYAGKRVLCPRAIYPWWREIWLERVESVTEISSQTIPTELTSSCDKHTDIACTFEQIQ